MGGISDALASAAREHGAEIRTNAEVAKIIVKNGRAAGVALRDGMELRAKVVASCVDSHVTFRKLMDQRDLPADFVAAIDAIDYSAATCKINVLVSEPPNFTACPGTNDGQGGPQH